MPSRKKRPRKTQQPNADKFEWTHLLGQLQQWLKWLLGDRVGQVMFVLLLLCGMAVWNWDKVQKLPGVDRLVTWRLRADIPHVDRQTDNRYAVAVAHLEFDENKKYTYADLIENTLVDALGDTDSLKDASKRSGIQILRFDRTISLATGANLEERIRAGHQEARRYLKESGADALIWGTVYKIGDKSALRLYWTPTSERKHAPSLSALEPFALPELFWPDLAEVLLLVVATHASKCCVQEGQFIAEQLRPFIERVRKLVDRAKGQEWWSAATATGVQGRLASALMLVGEETGERTPLEEAVVLCREALTAQIRKDKPLLWAGLQKTWVRR